MPIQSKGERKNMDSILTLFSFCSFFLWLRKFSNLNVVHKDLLMQDWVFSHFSQIFMIRVLAIWIILQIFVILNIVQGTPQNFTTIDGDKKIVPMMTRTSLQNCGARFETEIVPDAIFTTVAIPYAVILHRTHSVPVGHKWAKKLSELLVWIFLFR